MVDDTRAVMAAVERAGAGVIPSRQPQEIDADRLYMSLVRWTDEMNITAPDYAVDTRARDQWLDDVWRKEPFMAGVISSATSTKKNQGYTLIGGRNRVNYFDQAFHNANGGRGWREYSGQQSHSYFTSDLGSASEIARGPNVVYPSIDQVVLTGLLADARAGKEYAIDELLRLNDYIARLPFGGLYHIDTTHCLLTSDPYAPLEIQPNSGGTQRWLNAEFFRFASQPTGRYGWNRIGFCALSRAITLLQIMVAIHRHDKEQLNAAAPAGFLALKGISQTQWDNAMAARREDRANASLLYMRDLMVLANANADVSATLISLSQLPTNFKLSEWMEVYMQGCSLAFGFDVREFYTIRGGSLGVNGEAIVQDEKTTAKGESDFTLEHAEQIQKLLPPGIEFAYDERNTSGDLQYINAQKAYSEMILGIYREGKDSADPILNAEQVRKALVMQKILTDDILNTESDSSVATDTENAEKERARANPMIRRAAEDAPDEPIVKRHSDGREFVLWRSGAEMLAPRYYTGVNRATVYKEGDIVITTEDIAAVKEEAKRIDPKLALLLSAGKAEQ